MTCVAASGIHPLRFTWTQDGRKLANSAVKYAKVLLDNISTLTIEAVAAEDIGNYTCTVTNDVGTDSTSATLIVEGEA